MGGPDLQKLIETAVARQNDVLIITSADGGMNRIIYANPAIVRHSGYSVDEVIGRTPRMFQGPGTSRATLDLVRAAVDARKPIRAELLNYSKNGAPYWTEIDISPIFDAQGTATHMVSVQRDITEQKNNSDAVQRSDSRFRLALKASANAIWEWNLATGEVEYRDEIPGMSWRGRRHGNASGRDLSILLEHVHPEDSERVRQSIMAHLQGNGQLHIVEYRLRRPDGTYADVSDRQFIVRNPQGMAERLVGSVLDISDTRELENRRLKSQRRELLGEMTGGIAHNFNNLLTVIQGNIERLRTDWAHGEAILDTIRRIDEAAQRGAKLTKDLMLFSHGTALSVASVDLGRMIDGASLVWRSLLAPKIALDLHIDPGIWPVNTDTAHLEAAMLNLVINARDAMPEGGTLLIKTENIPAGSRMVRVGDGGQAARYVMITVTDTGIGMPAEHVKAAFEPFFTTKTPGDGTGLGLSSAREFLQQSGGFVRLTSEVGVGTTVQVFLPAADGAPLPEITTKPRNLPTDGGHCILVVDDDTMVREFVQAVLTSLRYKVVTASNGDEALRVLASGHKVDLLFTDIFLSNSINGWELARRAQAEFPDLPVLFTSGYPDAVEAPSPAPIGALSLLRKPYRIHDLSTAILSAIAAAEKDTALDE